jgi:hypothetical protein
MDINDSKLYKILVERESDFLPNIKKVFNYAKDLLPQVINVFSNYTVKRHIVAITNVKLSLTTQLNLLQINSKNARYYY